jgi:transposase
MSDPYQNIRWLQRWYVDYDNTQTELAERCGVSTKTISNWVGKFGLKKNRHDPDWLTDKYVRERLPQRQIGELCGPAVRRSETSYGNMESSVSGITGTQNGWRTSIIVVN